ncbi:MAG TPA: peptidoglycan DD-metalloendopeptidase family protein [Gemmatimonadaceae bacterium]|nr:peptidoglycan DD-metalloendopeptidase family protein [Gemmatimonadaceae bacterium]
MLIAFNSVGAQVTGHAPVGAKLSIPQLGLHTIADSAGRFAFDSVGDGRWVIESRALSGVTLTLADVRHGAASVVVKNYTAPSATVQRADCGGSDTTDSAMGGRATSAQARGAQQTSAQATGAPTTGAPATGAQTTGAQATGAQTTGARARAASPLASLSWRPAQPAPGTLIEMTSAGDSVRAIWGRVADEPVLFRRDSANAFVALAAVPLDVTTVHAVLRYRRTDGAIIERDTTLGVTAPPPAVVASAAKPEKLHVAAEFSRPATTNTTRRIEGESELARTVGAIALATPPLWQQPFMRPRASRITSGFASGRKFNGTLTSRHTGVDFRGQLGDPVQATNRGVVALVADFYLAGTVVYIVHGAGLVSGYFHLSATPVAIGDTVQRGQIIGRVGQSGRVTGPHLHWIIRYDHTSVDPMGVLSLGWIPKRDYGTCRGPDSSSH